jgi:hypothetical protein
MGIVKIRHGESPEKWRGKENVLRKRQGCAQENANSNAELCVRAHKRYVRQRTQHIKKSAKLRRSEEIAYAGCRTDPN